MIEETTIAIVVSILAPLITIVMAKLKSQTAHFKKGLDHVIVIANEIDEIMKDDKITPEEAKRLIGLIRKVIK